MSSSPTKSKTKKRVGHFLMQWLSPFISRERVSDFSLEIHAIEPLVVDGAGRESVLRGAGCKTREIPIYGKRAKS